MEQKGLLERQAKNCLCLDVKNIEGMAESTNRAVLRVYTSC